MFVSFSMLEWVSASNCCTRFMALSWSSSCCSIWFRRVHINLMDFVIVCSVLLNSSKELMELGGRLIVLEFTEYPVYPLTTEAHELACEELYLLTDDVALSKCGSFFWFWKLTVALSFTSGTKCSGMINLGTEVQCSWYSTLRLVCSHLVVLSKVSVVVYTFQ